VRDRIVGSTRLANQEPGAHETIAMNAALAMIEATAPRDEMEAAVAIQMACTHAATMSVPARLGGGTRDRTTGRIPWIGRSTSAHLQHWSDP
jgi:hypothetical protein